jgi:anti-sigma regulatory factor (Ser/Thr protein kinase)
VSAWQASGPIEPLVESYPPVAESVARARRALARLAAACGAAVEQIDCIRLAVSEAMTSAVVEGEGAGEPIRVRATVIEDALAVSIAAERSRLPAIRTVPGLGPGVGLALIAHATDELAIGKHAAGGTELRMRFGLGSVSPQT